MEHTTKRAKKFEFIIIGVVVAAALLGMYLLNSRPSDDADSNYAVVSIDGKAVEVVRLADYTKAEPSYVDLHQWGIEGKLELNGGQIRFIEVSCPDHICEKQGFIGQELQSAVCMPNRVSVSIYSSEDARQYINQVKK